MAEVEFEIEHKFSRDEAVSKLRRLVGGHGGGALFRGPRRPGAGGWVLFSWRVGGGGGAVGDPGERTADIQTKDEARFFLGTSVKPGPDAKRPMIAMHPACPALQMLEPRPPHDGAIAKDPQITRG